MKKSPLLTTAVTILTFASLLLSSSCSKSSTDTINNWGEDLTKALTTEKPFQEIELFYGTDRQSGRSTEPGKAFNDKRGDLSWGACSVAVPYSKEAKRLKKSAFTMTSYGMRPSGRYTLTDVRQLPRQSFETILPKRLARSPQKTAMVFVHGTDTSFEEAALSTARLSYHLQYQGAPIFFSWPSQAEYLQDEKNAQFSIAQLTEFIKTIAQKLEAEDIYLIGDGMGCLPLCEAMTKVELAPADMARIKNLILIAPDINRNKFAEEILTRMHNTSAHITVYTSNNDDALTAAHKKRAGTRLGDVFNNAEMPGIDFVDASAVSTNMNGKPAVAKKASVYNDISSIIK